MCPIRSFLALLLLHALAGCGRPADPPATPNLLVLVSDDQGLVLGAYGHPDVQTPRLDALAARSVVFERAYAPTAVCTPSRSTLYTGLMPMNHGARGFEAVADDVRVWGELFADAGYRTGLIGKIGAKPVKRFTFDFKARSDRRDAEARDLAWHVDQLERFLNEDDGRPWCLIVNFRDSHWPFPTDGAPFGPDSPPPHDPAALSVPADLLDAPAVRAELARYYDGLRRMDATAGALLDLLDARGQSKNLVGLFTSDNGPPFPYAKTTLAEAGTHMPLMAFGTGVQPSRRGEFIGLADVLPTLMELADHDVPGLDGRSFAPALTGAALGTAQEPWRDQIATTQDSHRIDPAVPARGVRFGRWKYIRSFGEGLLFENNVMRTSETWRAMVDAAASDPVMAGRVERMRRRPSEELYDLDQDPLELNDLSADPAHAETLEEARRRLASSTWIDTPAGR